MAKVIFRLRTNKGTKPQQIYLVYRFGRDEKLMFPVGFSISPQYWNDRTSRPRDIAECTTKDIILNALDCIETDTNRWILAEKAANRVVSKDSLRQFLSDRNKPLPTTIKTDFLDYCDNFAATADKRLNPATGRVIGKGTVREYRRVNSYIQGFAVHKSKKITFSDINLDFYSDFVEYLTSELKAGTNTIGKYIQDIKTIMNAATMEGVNTNLQYKSPRFKAISEESESIYLTEKELQKLADFDFSARPALERVRDLFLIGAYTGLRFSDFTQINKATIRYGNINIVQQKTGKKVVIPLHPVVIEIWNKYGEQLPRTISNQKFNDYIKQVCRLAGIDEPIIKHFTKAGIKQSINAPKWEYIGAHTARRSFATNLFLSGFPALSIMQITGHKTERAFLRYIKVTGEQHANLLRLHWIQKGQYIKAAR